MAPSSAKLIPYWQLGSIVILEATGDIADGPGAQGSAICSGRWDKGPPLEACERVDGGASCPAAVREGRTYANPAGLRAARGFAPCTLTETAARVDRHRTAVSGAARKRTEREPLGVCPRPRAGGAVRLGVERLSGASVARSFAGGLGRRPLLPQLAVARARL
jgi:hypothetical protein